MRSITAAAIVVAGALVIHGSQTLAQSNAAQWKSAAPGYQLSLPRDHVSHPAYKIERCSRRTRPALRCATCSSHTSQ